MKLHVLHDDRGYIHALVATESERAGVRMMPRHNAGERASTVEVPDAASSRWHEQFRDLARKYRVDLSSDVPRLVERAPPR
jgi:hypothetical protein